MYVHPFWFGVLMAIVAMIVLFLGFGIVRALTSEEDEENEQFEEEFRDMMEKISGGKNVRIYYQDGMLVGETIEDKDHEDDHQ